MRLGCANQLFHRKRRRLTWDKAISQAPPPGTRIGFIITLRVTFIASWRFRSTYNEIWNCNVCAPSTYCMNGESEEATEKHALSGKACDYTRTHGHTPKLGKVWNELDAGYNRFYKTFVKIFQTLLSVSWTRKMIARHCTPNNPKECNSLHHPLFSPRKAWKSTDFRTLVMEAMRFSEMHCLVQYIYTYLLQDIFTRASQQYRTSLGIFTFRYETEIPEELGRTCILKLDLKSFVVQEEIT